jgi:hypothetical protein
MLVLLLLPIAESAMAIEEPAYTVVTRHDGIEYRQYQSYLVAETVVADTSDRNDAASAGFRRLFKYITGDNSSSKSISMTAPVRQIPVNGGWKVGFVVPSEFTRETTPAPSSATVAIADVPAQLVAVLRYSGRWTDKNLQEHRDELMQKLSALGIKPVGEVVSAAYNAPFTPPFMRRNEVMVAVDRAPLP